MHPSWERRDILPFGIQTAWENKVRLDNYWVRQGSSFDTPPTDPNIDEAVVRAVPSTQLTASLPLVRPAKKFNMLIEPKTALTLATNSNRDDDIPNEDSRDVQIDLSNLFADTRFPGKDRVETGSHVSYGVKFGGYDTRGNSAYATLGQSYRLTDRNPFPQGSGLENDRSDLVGQIEATLYDKFYMDYRFQLDEDDLSDRRHELQGIYLGDGLELRTNYVFAEQVQGTGLTDNRHQIEFEAAKSLTSTWSAAVDSIHDLSGEGGLLKTGATLQYKNECLRAGVRVERDLTESFTGGGDSRILFSLGLRNFGGYETPLLEDDPLYRPFAKAKNL
jgi:LPS-assembly protein